MCRNLITKVIVCECDDKGLKDWPLGGYMPGSRTCVDGISVLIIEDPDSCVGPASLQTHSYKMPSII